MVLNSEIKKNVIPENELATYIKKVTKYPSLSAEEEQETARLAQSGSKDAKQKLIKANLKLVVIIARKFIHTSKLPMVDLIQDGNIALIAAVDKFNWRLGYRFATYASWWIKQAMFKAISEQSHSVKIPVYIQETLSKYSKVKAELERETNMPVNIEDIAQRMNIDSGKINNYLNANKVTLSLEGDYEMQNGSEVKLIDIIEDNRNCCSQKVERDMLTKEIVSILSTLKDREQKVITLRFGLNNSERQTLEEIGKIYGVTKECIRQTENRVLNKLRNSSQMRNLYSDYVGV